MTETDAMPRRLLLVGYGRMGRLVDGLSGEYGFEVAGRLDRSNIRGGEALDPARWPSLDVVIDFSTADALAGHLPRLTALGVPLVIGTTGWQAHEAEARRLAGRAGIGVVAAPNCSVGVVLFEAIVERAAGLFAARPEYGAWLHEAHHAAKRDAPSGTALALASAMTRAGFERTLDVASTRAGSIPGIHTVGFDGPADTVTLTHTARDRSAFARGALTAARWVIGRHGWFSMRDVVAGARKAGTHE